MHFMAVQEFATAPNVSSSNYLAAQVNIVVIEDHDAVRHPEAAW
jgi:hypothetical protein